METPGNLFCVAAPSGAGKSSLVKALLELPRAVPDDGSTLTPGADGIAEVLSEQRGKAVKVVVKPVSWTSPSTHSVWALTRTVCPGGSESEATSAGVVSTAGSAFGRI